MFRNRNKNRREREIDRQTETEKGGDGDLFGQFSAENLDRVPNCCVADIQ